ncbi:hypothetical protein B0H17DRAFT_1290194 [Mycena rosella]|uniref:Uncharacterized protein n=1 Tax=Mycena rosella TaxID=1033263 RepID=A0AAD7DFL9_MYCRO|nr:hypothetical protein B0H17DRAFT_1290194 [Mycena rosella]
MFRETEIAFARFRINGNVLVMIKLSERGITTLDPPLFATFFIKPCGILAEFRSCVFANMFIAAISNLCENISAFTFGPRRRRLDAAGTLEPGLPSLVSISLFLGSPFDFECLGLRRGGLEVRDRYTPLLNWPLTLAFRAVFHRGGERDHRFNTASPRGKASKEAFVVLETTRLCKFSIFYLRTKRSSTSKPPTNYTALPLGTLKCCYSMGPPPHFLLAALVLIESLVQGFKLYSKISLRFTSIGICWSLIYLCQVSRSAAVPMHDSQLVFVSLQYHYIPFGRGRLSADSDSLRNPPLCVIRASIPMHLTDLPCEIPALYLVSGSLGFDSPPTRLPLQFPGAWTLAHSRLLGKFTWYGLVPHPFMDFDADSNLGSAAANGMCFTCGVQGVYSRRTRAQYLDRTRNASSARRRGACGMSGCGGSRVREGKEKGEHLLPHSGADGRRAREHGEAQVGSRASLRARYAAGAASYTNANPGRRKTHRTPSPDPAYTKMGRSRSARPARCAGITGAIRGGGSIHIDAAAGAGGVAHSPATERRVEARSPSKSSHSTSTSCPSAKRSSLTSPETENGPTKSAVKSGDVSDQRTNTHEGAARAGSRQGRRAATETFKPSGTLVRREGMSRDGEGRRLSNSDIKLHGNLRDGTSAIKFFSSSCLHPLLSGRMARTPRDIIPWSALTAQELKSIFIDLIQGHHKYYVRTGQSPFGGYLFPENTRCDLGAEQKCGILVDLDSLYPPDPLLLACAGTRWAQLRTMAGLPRARTYDEGMDPAAQCSSELSMLIHLVYLHLITLAVFRGISNTKTFLWQEPGPFQPQFSSIIDTWLRPLCRLAGEWQFATRRGLLDPTLCGRLTHGSLMTIIVSDFGPGELVFRAALRAPLPLPAPAEIAAKPAFESLIHIPTVSQFKRAVIDIANAIEKSNDAALCFPALTPDRMLFQHHNLSPTSPLGFVLDLDHLDAPESLTACAGVHPAALAMRFAAYDLISGPSVPPLRGLLARHALEALFNALVWFYVSHQFCNSSNGSGRLSPRPRTDYAGTWLDPAAHALPSDRTSYTYQAFLQSRRAFLWDGAGGFLDAKSKSRTDDMCELRDAWLEPLWTMISEALFFARWREGERGFDWDTLGGQFTAERFMAILVPGSAA